MVGKPARVPYMKGNFRVEGLPEGIPFKKPNRYGSNQIRKIFEAEPDIMFYPDEQAATLPDENTNSVLSAPNEVSPHVEVDTIQSVLIKVVGPEVTEMVLKDKHQITEEEVEVIDLKLSNEERLVLYGSCMQYFEPDAWLGCCCNIQHPLEEKGIITPVLSNSGDEGELFWLFYCPNPLKEIIAASPKKPISGYWLNLLDDSAFEYEILVHERARIAKINMIKLENGLPLYSLCNLQIKEGETFSISKLFRDTITTVINRNKCNMLT